MGNTCVTDAAPRPALRRPRRAHKLHHRAPRPEPTAAPTSRVIRSEAGHARGDRHDRSPTAFNELPAVTFMSEHSFTQQSLSTVPAPAHRVSNIPQIGTDHNNNDVDGEDPLTQTNPLVAPGSEQRASADPCEDNKAPAVTEDCFELQQCVDVHTTSLGGDSGVVAPLPPAEHPTLSLLLPSTFTETDGDRSRSAANSSTDELLQEYSNVRHTHKLDNLLLTGRVQHNMLSTARWVAARRLLGKNIDPTFPSASLPNKQRDAQLDSWLEQHLQVARGVSQAVTVFQLQLLARAAERRSLNYGRQTHSGMDAILPGLFLGSYHVASNPWKLREEHNVEAVISCVGPHNADVETRGQSCVTYCVDGVTFLCLSARDTHEYRIDAHFADCLEFLRRWYFEEGKNVLIHCGAGVSRAPTITIAFLVAFLNMSVQEALSFVQESRPCVCPTTWFLFLLLRAFSPAQLLD